MRSEGKRVDLKKDGSPSQANFMALQLNNAHYWLIHNGETSPVTLLFKFSNTSNLELEGEAAEVTVPAGGSKLWDLRLRNPFEASSFSYSYSCLFA